MTLGELLGDNVVFKHTVNNNNSHMHHTGVTSEVLAEGDVTVS